MIWYSETEFLFCMNGQYEYSVHCSKWLCCLPKCLKLPHGNRAVISGSRGERIYTGKVFVNQQVNFMELTLSEQTWNQCG